MTGGGGVFLLLSSTSRYTFLSYPSYAYVYPFLLWSFAFALSFCFFNLHFSGTGFRFFSSPLYFTVWSGSGYRIDLHDNSLLSCHSIFVCFV